MWWRWLGKLEVGADPIGSVMGWSGPFGSKGSWADWGKIQGKDIGPQGGLHRKQRIKEMGCINGFWIYFKSKDSNIFKQNLNRSQVGKNLNNFLKTFQILNFSKLVWIFKFKPRFKRKALESIQKKKLKWNSNLFKEQKKET
jgi:hypothetical protein